MTMEYFRQQESGLQELKSLGATKVKLISQLLNAEFYPTVKCESSLEICFINLQMRSKKWYSQYHKI